MNNEFLLSVKLSKRDRDHISRVIRCNFPPGTIFIRKRDKKVGSTRIVATRYRDVKEYITKQTCICHNLNVTHYNLLLEVYIDSIGYIELYVGKCLINNSHLKNIALITTILKDIPLNIVIRKIKRQII